MSRKQLAIADELLTGRDHMFEPQDLPGRYGRVIKDLDRVLNTADCVAVIRGEWAVWRRGFLGRVTQDVDILVPSDRVDELLRVAGVSGFEVLRVPAGRGPKLVRQATGVQVDLLPGGQRPGTPTHPPLTPLPHPSTRGAQAARARDEADVDEKLRANDDDDDQVGSVRQHLTSIHADYVARFDLLARKAREQPAD